MNLKKIALAGAIVGLASLGATRDANAIPLIAFGQTADVNTITAVNNGAGTTTISAGAGGAAVTITQLEDGANPLNAFLVLNATSAGASQAILGGFGQFFTGTFSITSGAGGAGTNYLSGSFTNAILGGLNGGAQATFGGAQPPNTLTFTSGVIDAGDLGVARGLTFSFTNVTPAFGVTNNSISSFTATVSGNASGNVQVSQIPEPASLLLLGTGLAAAARARRRKATKA